MARGRWLIGIAAALGLSQVATAAPPPAPKLIVALSIDQFADEIFQRYRPTFKGGLRRLARGITFTGYQSHSGTETCPGHSTLLTGRHPSGTGIISNQWYDAKSATNVYCVSVPGAPADARGPQNLRVPTFGEWMKQARPDTRVFAVSGKDRAAITMAGHKPDAVYWFDGVNGFVTSPYAGPATPEILAPAQAFDQATFAAWRASPPTFWPDKVPARCKAMEKPQQLGSYLSSGHIPPDASRGVTDKPDFIASPAFQDQLRASPLYDNVLLDFADQVIDHYRIGHGPGADLLAISFSATDYVGHRFGNGGPEMCVQLSALDRTLAVLFRKLDGLGVPYVVVLSADHGGTDAAERLAAQGEKAQRIDASALLRELNRAVKAQLGLAADPFKGDPENPKIAILGDEALRGRIRDAGLAWFKARPEVVEARTAEEVAAATPPRGKPPTELSFLERFNESYDAERSGDLFVAFLANSSFGIPTGPTSYAAGHGSPWDRDRRVPILFWWKGVEGAVRPEPIETVDIAPTLAAIAGIPAPPVDGRCLAMVAGRCP